MRIAVTGPSGERDLVVALRADASVDDLTAALGGTAGPLTVDGRPVLAGGRAALAGVRDGSRVGLPGSAGFAPVPEQAAYEVVVAGGLDAGARWPLEGEVLVGRGPRAQVVLRDPRVSAEHVVLERAGDRLRVRAVSDRPVLVDGRLVPLSGELLDELDAAVRVGRSELQTRPVPVDRSSPGPAGFSRPPRPAAPAPVPVPLPPYPPIAVRREPFSAAALVGPLVLAAVLVVVTGDARFALFSALSPVLGVGTWWEGRRRARRADRLAARRHAEELAAHEDAVRDAGRRERARLRAALPDPAEVLRRAAVPSTRLWERREGSADLLLLSCGTADLPPAVDPVRGTGGGAGSDLVPGTSTRGTVESGAGSGRAAGPTAGPGPAGLSGVPVPVDLGPGVLGLVGDRAAALAAARALLCAAVVGAGPADLAVAVCAGEGREQEWAWTGWLPHAEARLAAGRGAVDALLRPLLLQAGRLLVVLDDAALTTGPDAPARELLRREGVGALVLAATAEALPASCSAVLECRADGTAELHRPAAGTTVPDVLLAGLSAHGARRCARDLSRLADPERRRDGAGLPAAVRLLGLLGVEDPTGRIDPQAVRDRWRAGGADPGLRTPLGVGEDGPFVLDLVRDGAHGLVGGTTGSGKSELLRSLVAGLAVHAGPDHLSLVLVDYKGGAAFDACQRLPQVVGLVTDLDEQLGERALRALAAELHRRERLLRQAGVADLPGYLALGRRAPLPRLLVVIDEFATLAKELPDFLTALVGIAQRGRTLGVHLLLATQRPSGAVDDNIRANTNLRIALRVQDAADSTDVIGGPQAAAIGRDRPGRAHVRLGPGEVVPIQTALVTGSGPPAGAPVVVRPLGFPAPPDARADRGSADGPSDLERLVDAVVAAAAGTAPPHRPWPEPLPAVLPLELLLARAQVGPATSTARPAAGGLVAAEPDEVVSDGALAALVATADHVVEDGTHAALVVTGEDTVGTGAALVALADDPDRQAQHAAGWELDQGGLLLLGPPGSGTTTALVALAVSLAAATGPDRLELHALDFGVGDLQVLTTLPHTGAVLPAADRERQARLLHRLAAELARRRALPRDPSVRTVLLVDNLPALRAAYDDVAGLELLDLLARLHADGPEVGICVALTADRPGAVPGAIAAVTAQKWVFRLADPFDHAALGVPRSEVPPALPGRAVLLPSHLQAQVGLPTRALVEQVARRWQGVRPRARPVGALPSRLHPDDLGTPATVGPERWELPVGLAGTDLGVATLVLHEGDGALVAGPARSGRTGVLVALAEQLAAAGVTVLGTGGRRSALAASPALTRWWDPGELPALLAAARGPRSGLRSGPPPGGGPTVVLIDDAERLEDPDGDLARLVADPGPALRVVAAGRSDALRTAYAHWTTTLRRSRTGLLLCPQVDLDGDLLAVTLPRRAPVPLTTARGYLVVDGHPVLVQAATSSPDAA